MAVSRAVATGKAEDGIRAEEVNTRQGEGGRQGWLAEKGNMTVASPSFVSSEGGEVRSGNLALFSRGARYSCTEWCKCVPDKLR